MTRDRDIERVLDRFYAEGPSEMPDRLLLGVFDRIEHVPQRRLALLTRFATMNTNLRLAAAAAIVVAVVGVGAFALSQRPSVGPQSTPTVSPSLGPAASSSLSPMPAALAYRWIGTPRTVPEITPPLDASMLWLEPSGYLLVGVGQAGFDPSVDEILVSKVGLSSPDTIVFTLGSPGNGCQRGDVGTYTFSLSASGKVLTLAEIADACAARSGAVSGDWNRADCPDRPDQYGNYLCLGDMDPGTHVSAVFNPIVALSPWVPNYGALSYQVPVGWKNIVDYAGAYALTKQGAAANGPRIILASCATGAQPGIGHTPAELANWLKGEFALVATTPAPITVGGLSGMTLDLSGNLGWTVACPGGEPVLYAPSDWAYQRVIFLDTGGGLTLLVEVEAPDQASFDAFIVEAMPVIQSFQFKP
jgi:hypothetical protein